MYTVILVDDEITAIHFMERVIQKRCPDFEVIATVFDGREALDKIRDLKPDVCVFDINMPRMNGLEMAERIKAWNLPIVLVVVSGYSEFDYARGAMQSGAIDYLLKPVMPDMVHKLFREIAIKLEYKYYMERRRIMSLLYKDEVIGKDEIEKYFGGQKFYMALGRVNGLPLCFVPVNTREIFSDVHERIMMYGRDERENIILCPENIPGDISFEDIVGREMNKLKEGKDYCTCILSITPIGCTEISDMAKKMYHMLHNNVVLGKNLTVWVEQYEEKKICIDDTEKRYLDDFDYYIEKNEQEKLKVILAQLFTIWEEKERPLLWVERRIRNMIAGINQISEMQNYDCDYMENESALEEAFADSGSWEQLQQSIVEIIFKDQSIPEEKQKLDTDSFVQEVCCYIETHLDEELKRAEVGKEFGISQTYLGKLFRKYKAMSFNTYVTMKRMEAAKMMLGQKDILIKDIAARLGFQDQFYFSRVFRSYTGVLPTEFLENRKG